MDRSESFPYCFEVFHLTIFTLLSICCLLELLDGRVFRKENQAVQQSIVPN